MIPRWWPPAAPDTIPAMNADPTHTDGLDAPSPDVITDGVRQRLSRFVTARARGAPAILLLGGLVVALDPVPWRVAAVATLSALAISLARWSARSARAAADGMLPESALPRNILGMWFMQLGMVTASGGLDSPLLPVLVPLAFIGGLIDGRPWMVARFAAIEVGAVVTLTALQTSGALPALEIPWLSAPTPRPPEGRALSAFTLSVILVVGNGIGVTLRRQIEAVVSSALIARSEAVHLWRTQSRELQVLSAEIAHELKNPLTSITGLSALLARDLPEGRAAERLGVLRSEVDRMSGILEEFLTFSRPLVPLSLAPVSPDGVVAHVLALHEGLATGRGVQLVQTGAAPAIRADARKLTQILVNLVQNALDAAPAGTAVTVRSAADGDRAVLEVSDRGPGVSPDLLAHVFEPGVTRKAHGSGLGLTVARALAVQHGGSLTLAAAPGGGTVARLTLPAAGPAPGGA